MDRAGANFFEVVRQVREMLGANPVPLQIPIGAEENFEGVIDLIENKAVVWFDDAQMGSRYELQEIPENLKAEAEEWRGKLVEAVAEHDDELMEMYFEDPDSITREQMLDVIRKATIAQTITPMMCGSAFKNKGVQRLLDAVIQYLPSPSDIGTIEGVNPKTDETVTYKMDEDEPLSALAFKIATDPFVGRLAFMRVYSGKIDAGSYVLNTRTDKKERISRLYQMKSNKQLPREVIGAGDICAGVGFKDIRTGDTLCDEKHPIVLESMDFPEVSSLVATLNVGSSSANLPRATPNLSISFCDNGW